MESPARAAGDPEEQKGDLDNPVSRSPATRATHRKTNRGAAPGPALEPIEIAKFWRNRRGEAVVVELREYEGHPILDARVHFTDREGYLRPSKKGLTVSLARLPDLLAALSKAERKAIELGLLAGNTK